MNRLVGLAGSGVGMAAEYRQHRKDQKTARENSQDQRQSPAGPSRTVGTAHSSSMPRQDSLPPYTEVPNAGVEHSVISRGPLNDDKKGGMAKYDDYDYNDESSDDDSDSIEDDEEDWELDEMVSRSTSPGLPSYDQSEKDYSNTDDLVRDTMAKNRSSSLAPDRSTFLRKPLPCPVIIPQRRPRKKARGFVHAYAPLLGECSGIDQDTFISFLDNFYKSSQASPVFGVIQLSAAIAGIAPSVIAMAVTTGVQIAARVGEEVQVRQRTNTYLDKMNDQLFKPAGLYAMIVKYKSEQEVRESGNSFLARFGVSGEKIDLSTNQTIAKYNDSEGMSSRMQNLRVTSTTTNGSINLPQAAPLVFPDIDRAIAKNGEETFKDKAADAKHFLTDYLDRRAQLQYAREDPNSSLTLPEEKRSFRSSLADPAHPMYQGGIINFASGGMLKQNKQNRNQRDGLDSRDGRDDDYDGDDYARGGRRARRQERRTAKYERRMDGGRDLGRRGKRRYDRMNADRDDSYSYNGRDSRRRGGRGGRISGVLGADQSGGYGDDSRDSRRSGRRSGGRGGLISGLIGAVADRGNETQQSYGSRNREFEDSYPSRRYEDKSGMRRSFDDQDRPFDGPSSDASYEGQRSYRGGRGNRRQQKSNKNGLLGTVRRVMKEDVLYLMIVNMPSEAELAEAKETLERAKRGQ